MVYVANRKCEYRGCSGGFIGIVKDGGYKLELKMLQTRDSSKSHTL